MRRIDRRGSNCGSEGTLGESEVNWWEKHSEIGKKLNGLGRINYQTARCWATLGVRRTFVEERGPVRNSSKGNSQVIPSREIPGEQKLNKSIGSFAFRRAELRRLPCKSKRGENVLIQSRVGKHAGTINR